MKKNIVIVHYNTPLLTECLVRSINLFVKDAIIYIFDNSDERPFTAHFDNVLVLDSTKGEISQMLLSPIGGNSPPILPPFGSVPETCRRWK